MGQISLALGCIAYLSVWRVKGVFCVEHLVFSPHSPPLSISTVYQCDGCLSSWGCGGSCLGYKVLPANFGAVSILELATNRGSLKMSKAPNDHLVM